MIVNVRMRDGRTTFQFASRKDYINALNLNRPPEEMAKQVACSHSSDDEDWRETRVLHLSRASIAYVVDAATMEDDLGLPAQGEADRRKAEWEAEARRREDEAMGGGEAGA